MNGRFLGAIAFFKLAIDEVREQCINEPKSNLLYELLSDLSQVLTSIYDQPKSTAHAKNLINIMNCLT